MEEQYKQLQKELIEISLIPPDKSNIPILRKGGPIYKELSEKYN
jgi:hypothetical protein